MKHIKCPKTQYSYFKITPDTSVKNNSFEISKAIRHILNVNNKFFDIKDKVLYIYSQNKISFFVDIRKNDISFYFIVPSKFKSYIREKLYNSYPKVTIEEVTSIDSFDNATAYGLSYKYDDALSLNIDKRSNEPLGSLLSVKEVMSDNDRVGILYNFLSTNETGWKNRCEKTISNYKNSRLIEKRRWDTEYIVKSIFNSLLSIIDSVLNVIDDLLGIKKPKEEGITFLELGATLLNQNKSLSNSTISKKVSSIIKTQILLLNKGNLENIDTISTAFDVVAEDNKLLPRRVKNNNFYFDKAVYDAPINFCSINETSNFIQLPSRDLIKKFNINKVSSVEVKIPEKLQNGYVFLGTNKYKDSYTKVYLENQYNVGNLPLTLVGQQGSGKTTYIKNLSKYCNNNGEGVIILDFIKNCELSKDVEGVIKNKNDIVIIDLSKENDIQGLGFNEIRITDDLNNFRKLELANLQAQQTLALVDAIGIGDPLSSSMRRYLSAACNICYVLNKNSIKTVIEVLERPSIRSEIINELNSNLASFLSDEIETLKNLDKVEKDGSISNKDIKIEGILDRINLLREDFKLKYMFNKDCKDNVNLVDLMDAGKTVLIRMPQDSFSSKMVKNVLITYWISKIWISSEIRGSRHLKPLRTNVIIDEVFQAPTSLKILEDIIPQARKFGTKFVFSTHYLKQLDKIYEALSGGTFMLLKGCNESDFKRLESLASEFTYDDIVDLKEYHSLNIVNYSDGYFSFIGKLPDA